VPSVFARRLAAFEGEAAPGATEGLAQRVSGWFDWTDAIGLSAALAAPPTAPAPVGPSARSDAHVRDAAQVRAALARAIEALPDSADADADFAPWRQHVLALQQAMDAAIGSLRRRLRAALEAGAPAHARLAALDAVLEQAIAPRERALLGGLASRLERGFERRLAAASPAVVRRELLELMQAELDLRMQPVEGLLAALRPPSSEST
jgi:hypothetical protein